MFFLLSFDDAVGNNLLGNDLCNLKQLFFVIQQPSNLNTVKCGVPQVPWLSPCSF